MSNIEEQSRLFGKYLISKADGTELDPQAEYFVVRYDATAAHGYAGRAALLEYAFQVMGDCPELACDLFVKLKDAPEQEIRVRAMFLLQEPPMTNANQHCNERRTGA